jgi:hypothetical protein
MSNWQTPTTSGAGRCQRATAAAGNPTVCARARIIPVTGPGSCGPARSLAARPWVGRSSPTRWTRCAPRSPPTAGSWRSAGRWWRSTRRSAKPATSPHRRSTATTTAGHKTTRGVVDELTAALRVEVAQLAQQATALLDPAGGAEGLNGLETAIRTAMSGLGATLLERLLAGNRGHRGTRIDCGQEHEAEFVGYRPKHLDTILGPASIDRAWYHCSGCHQGFAPRDIELGMAGASLTPGLRRMVARLAANQPFGQARDDLAEQAGIELTAASVSSRSATSPSTPSTSRWTAPECRACPPLPKAGPASSPAGVPQPARSSSPACSPSPASTTTAGRSAMTAARAIWPPSPLPMRSARWSTRSTPARRSACPTVGRAR